MLIFLVRWLVMCILFIAYRVYESCPFLLLDNRDEEFERKTQSLHQWEDYPGIIGSRDLERRGTWMAVNHHLKRFAVLTNLRESYHLLEENKQKRSRGLAVLNILTDTKPVEDALRTLQKERSCFAGFNLVMGDLTHWKTGHEQIWYFGSYLDEESSLQRLQPGKVYGLSNASLNTPWPKLKLGIKLVMELGEEKAADPEESFRILCNEQKVPRDQLVSTGLETLENEYYLSSIFVDDVTKNYGTRTSSLLMIRNNENKLLYVERNYEPRGYSKYSDTSREIDL